MANKGQQQGFTMTKQQPKEWQREQNVVHDKQGSTTRVQND